MTIAIAMLDGMEHNGITMRLWLVEGLYLRLVGGNGTLVVFA